MRLGRAAAYAVFATAHLAENKNGNPIQGREIAESCGVPSGHLLKILQQLVRARILSSERGPAGGFVLRKDPHEITLLEIIEAIDGPISGDLLLRNVAAGKEPTRVRLEQACREVADFAKSRLASTVISDFTKSRRR
ncbi:MAG: Rrf2 family transcriptional regulator [Phycisphaerae bacterium]|nr:Rrf2 family transcriptional regulator [Phycisphaerae bacterium]